MAGILGLRDSETDAANRFKNWRRTILYTFPNGKAPLTALLSLTEADETNDPEFNWFEEPLPTQRTLLEGTYNNTSSTSFTIDEAILRVGHLIKNETTDEIMLVSSVSADGLTIGVVRGKWGAKQNGTDDDPIVIIGNANAEGGPTPQIISYDPNPYSNYTQIFRSPFGVTGTYMKTSLKYDRSGPYIERGRQALNFHSIEMEKAFFEGRKALFVDPSTNKTMRTTDGVKTRIPAENILDLASISSSTLSQDLWDFWLEIVFRTTLNRNNEKLLLCGSGALAVLNTIMQNRGVTNLEPGDDTFGMQFQRYISPFGTVYVKDHPLWTQHPVWRYQAVMLDIHGLKYRYLTGRDTTKLRDRQNNGDDQKIDEFLTECGLEFQHPEAHGMLKSVIYSSGSSLLTSTTTTTTEATTTTPTTTTTTTGA